jgi:hypothetical protein
MQLWLTVLLAAAILGGCGRPEDATHGSSVASESPATSMGEAPSPTPGAIADVSCGGPGFPMSLLDEPGRAETLDDPAAEALRAHLETSGPDFAWLPDTGWREVVRTDTEVTYVADAAPGSDPPYAEVSVMRDGDVWRVAGWGQCRLQASVGPGLGLASFRVTQDVELGPEVTEIPVLVTERACNSGQDARGRIVQPRIVLGDQAVTVVFAVRPRGGDQDCPSNPETPHLLVLPEPLGDRTLLDGSEIPPRDATQCADVAFCAP